MLEFLDGFLICRLRGYQTLIGEQKSTTPA